MSDWHGLGLGLPMIAAVVKQSFNTTRIAENIVSALVIAGVLAIIGAAFAWPAVRGEFDTMRTDVAEIKGDVRTLTHTVENVQIKQAADEADIANMKQAKR